MYYLIYFIPLFVLVTFILWLVCELGERGVILRLGSGIVLILLTIFCFILFRYYETRGRDYMQKDSMVQIVRTLQVLDEAELRESLTQIENNLIKGELHTVSSIRKWLVESKPHEKVKD